MKSGSWVIEPATACEHGAPGLGTGAAPAMGAAATAMAMATTAAPTDIRFMLLRYTRLRSVRMVVTS